MFGGEKRREEEKEKEQEQEQERESKREQERERESVPSFTTHHLRATTTHTHTPPTPHRCPVVEPKWEAMMADHAGLGSARRRRERRLRSWWRHERMSIAAALVEATHHSAPRSEWPGTHKPHGDRRPPVRSGPDVLRLVRRGRRRWWTARSIASAACAAGASARSGGACTLTSPPVCVPKLDEDAVALRAWEVVEGRCFAGASHPLRVPP